MRTDRGQEPRHRALRATLPVVALRHRERPFALELGGSGAGLDPAAPHAGASRAAGPAAGGDAWGRLDASGCAGRLADADGEVQWELAFEPLLPPIAPTPELGARFATCYLEPHPLLRVTGVVAEGRRKTRFSGLLGEQAHVFGARHSRRWHWAECKHLGDTGGALIGVASWLPVGVPVTSLFLAHGEGLPLLRNTLPDMLRPRTSHDPSGWRFTAAYDDVRLVGAVTPRLEDLIGVTYHDPSGQPIYCYHCELADLSLRVERRAGGAWRTQELIEARSAAAFEYGGATRLPGVPLLLD
jgi:hypothetical protein